MRSYNFYPSEAIRFIVKPGLLPLTLTTPSAVDSLGLKLFEMTGEYAAHLSSASQYSKCDVDELGAQSGQQRCLCQTGHGIKDF